VGKGACAPAGRPRSTSSTMILKDLLGVFMASYPIVSKM
jgi:hypothetical protein